MNVHYFRVAALVFLAASAVAAGPTPKPATPAPPPPATPSPAEAAKVYSATDLDALRGAVGQTVTVTGTIVLSGESKTKTVRYLNFTKNFRESLGLVFFVSKGGEEFALEKLAPWVGKKVSATGKVGEYNGSLQMEIEKWEQVKETP